jgi:choline kinase
MKVILDGARLLRVGKKLPLAQVNGESLGMTLFRNEGSLLFRATLERMVQKSEAFKQWYLSVIDEIASSGIVWTQPMTGLEWTEIDDLEDLKYARNVVPYWTFQDEPLKAVAF